MTEAEMTFIPVGVPGWFSPPLIFLLQFQVCGKNLELKHDTNVPDILEVLECVLRMLLLPVGVEDREI